jgi:hypothetical protein
VTQTFQWQAEPVGNDTATATGSLNLLFGQGSTKPAETGLNIASNGQITFAPGQSGAGLGNVDASQLGGLGASAFAQLATANTFTANQTVNGNVSATQLVSTVAQGAAPLQVTSTTQVSNLNASLLGGSPASAFQPAGSYAVLNTNMVFGYQTVASNGGQATLMTIPNLGTVLVDCDSSLSRIAFFPSERGLRVTVVRKRRCDHVRQWQHRHTALQPVGSRCDHGAIRHHHSNSNYGHIGLSVVDLHLRRPSHRARPWVGQERSTSSSQSRPTQVAWRPTCSCGRAEDSARSFLRNTTIQAGIGTTNPIRTLLLPKTRTYKKCGPFSIISSRY